MQTLPNSPFKAYDIRGRIPDSLNPALAHRIGLAYAAVIQPAGPVVIGRDMRLSSSGLAQALAEGLNRAGIDTIDIGLCGTELVYHAASRPGMGGGIMVTASHNPADYNGMKMVREQAIPISADTGLQQIEDMVARGAEAAQGHPTPGQASVEDVSASYTERMLAAVRSD
jgi:phosphomannomutase